MSCCITASCVWLSYCMLCIREQNDAMVNLSKKAPTGAA
jgi:hypothetical protein